MLYLEHMARRFFGTAQAVNQPKYLPGFGKNGKFVESSRYKTIKISNFNTTDGLTARELIQDHLHLEQVFKSV
ncbi:MAG: hypothetical protein CM15mV120_320 [uncultured marine virus]|nr:MAG: hypothetical protein CM15mV120_320 [uncultured marine virus]